MERILSFSARWGLLPEQGLILCALSGGVDSSVAAVLLSRAIGRQLTCVFVDHGLLRKNEGDEVEAVYAYCNLHSLWKA